MASRSVPRSAPPRLGTREAEPLLALSAVETARTFRVSTGTVLRWESEAQAKPDRETVGSLLKPDPPVRRFADVVRHVVHTLTLAGFPGDASVAASLARAGWRLSRPRLDGLPRAKGPSCGAQPRLDRWRAARRPDAAPAHGE